MTALIALVTLTSLEIVLGVDNLVFIAIVTGRLPKQSQARARQLGLLGAMAARIVLLLGVTWIMKLEEYELFELFGHPFTGESLVLALGGLFLLGKATFEIHHSLEAPHPAARQANKPVATFGAAITQIMLIDMVFSLDSVITAVGMTDVLWVMITAIVVAVIVMMVFATPIARFIEKHPTVKMLALSFLLLIGVMLVADATGHEIPRGYIYFAMAFALLVELLNMRVRARRAGHAAAPAAD